jgi:hypothetical protein
VNHRTTVSPTDRRISKSSNGISAPNFTGSHFPAGFEKTEAGMMKAMIIETRRAVCAGPRSLLVPLPRPRPFGLEVRSRPGLYQARPDHAAQVIL